MAKAKTVPEVTVDVKINGGKTADLIDGNDVAEVHELVFKMLQKDILFKEQVVILCLNNALKIISFHRLSTGGLSASLIDIRVIALVAIKSLASGIVIAHNHPSGNVKPSANDRKSTREIEAGLKLLNIKLHDSIIVTDSKTYSITHCQIIKK